jgi:signal transduction histidine kinase
MRRLRLALLLGGIAFGVAAESTSYDDLGTAETVADFAVGSVLVVCGVVAWDRRPESRVGALMWLAGVTWFLGTAFEPALYLHRGPLVHLLLSYPTGRLRSRSMRATVAVAYVDAAIEPLASIDWLTLALAGAVATVAVQTLRSASGPARSAVRLALGAVLAFEAVLVLGVVTRLAGWDADRAVLWSYDLVIASTAIVLAVDLLRARWTEAVLTGLVVDLGAPHEQATLRIRLARALGDTSLVVGYRVAATGELVDEAGRPIKLPPPGSGRAVTSIDDRGEQVAVLVHDEALLTDGKLLESVAAAARIAVANAALQAEARARASELEASRRRIVEAGAAQRRRLERELRLGAEQRLANVAALLESARVATDPDADAIRPLADDLEQARGELREFAQGIHPAALTDSGLMPALALLAARSPISVQVTGKVDRLPEPVELALYFVCSEVLANVAKHAAASRASIELREEPTRILVTIEDDGQGGADPSLGSGLRGLADRVEALGGGFRVDSPSEGGTRVVAEVPIGASERG